MVCYTFRHPYFTRLRLSLSSRLECKNSLSYFCSQYLMADTRLHFGLTSVFTSRIRQYLFLLEVTNHAELICTVCEFLTTTDLINLLSTSKHFLSLQKVQSIEVRILRAKIDFYQKPRLHQPHPTSLLSCLPLHIHTEMPVVRSQKLKKEHEALKAFNKNIRFCNNLKKMGMTENKEIFQKVENKKDQLELTNLKQGLTHKSQLQDHSLKHAQNLTQSSTVKTLQLVGQSAVRTNDSLPAKVQREVRHEKSSGRQRVIEYNPLISRFHEIQYRLAKEDYENRKRKRMMQKNQKSLITMDELRKLAESDPCSREIYLKIYEEEKIKMQRQNIARLTMKSFKNNAQVVSKDVIAPEMVKKVAVVKQSMAGKLLSNIKSMIWKERTTISL